MSRWLRHLRWQVQRWWDIRRAPWPIVGECFGHRDDLDRAEVCDQCADDHYHEWVAWSEAPKWIAGGPGVPVRCRICGARKCDFDDCSRRRHDHTHPTEVTVAVLP